MVVVVLRVEFRACLSKYSILSAIILLITIDNESMVNEVLVWEKLF